MKIFFNEGNQIHNFISSSGSGTLINYGSGSGSDFLTNYGSGSSSSSTSQKVTVPTVPDPVPVPQRRKVRKSNRFADLQFAEVICGQPTFAYSSKICLPTTQAAWIVHLSHCRAEIRMIFTGLNLTIHPTLYLSSLQGAVIFPSPERDIQLNFYGKF
jgi:hypothetical protein